MQSTDVTERRGVRKYPLRSTLALLVIFALFQGGYYYCWQLDSDRSVTSGAVTAPGVFIWLSNSMQDFGICALMGALWVWIRAVGPFESRLKKVASVIVAIVAVGFMILGMMSMSMMVVTIRRGY